MSKPTFGTKNGDDLPGTAAVDHVLGLAGDDTITGFQGDDRINGGKGIDSAVYSGAFEDYIIQTRGNGRGVTTISGPDGTDRLINVEQLVFADVTVDVATGNVIGAADGTIVLGHADGTFNTYDSTGLLRPWMMPLTAKRSSSVLEASVLTVFWWIGTSPLAVAEKVP